MPDYMPNERKADDNNGQPNDFDAIRNLISAPAGNEGETYDLTLNGQDLPNALTDLQLSTGINVLNLGRRPKYQDEPQLVMDTKGAITEWKERFNRPGHIFETGERVIASTFVHINRDGNIELVADDQDGRMADKFHLVEATREIRDTLTQYQGAALGCVVKIRSVRQLDFQLSDIHEYDVSLEPNVLIPPINPTPEQLDNLPKGYRIILEGRVVKQGFDRVPRQWGGDEPQAFIILQTEDGRKIKIPSWRDKELTLSDGILENLRGKPIERGETIRIMGYVQEDTQGRRVHAHWNEPYLLESSPDRLDQYQQLRESISQRVEQFMAFVDTGDYSQARLAFADLRTEELIPDEGDQIMAIRESMPVDEQPIYDGHPEVRRSWAADVDNAYGVLIESMTKEEYLAFVREVSLGKREQIGKHCDESYVYLIMSYNDYDTESWVSALGDAIDERLRILEETPDDHELSFPHSYMLEQTLGYLSGVNDPRAVNKLLEVVRYSIDRKYYDKRQGRGDDWQCPHKFLSLLFKATDSLVRSLKEHPDNMSVITNLDELYAWHVELSQYPFNDFEVQHLEQIIRMFQVS